MIRVDGLRFTYPGNASDTLRGLSFGIEKGEISGFLFTGPLASFFIPRPWALLMGVLPTYWPVKAYFSAIEGPPGVFWTALVASVVFCSAVVAVLYRRFRRRTMAG